MLKYVYPSKFRAPNTTTSLRFRVLSEGGSERLELARP